MSKLRCLDLTGKLIALFILFLYYKSITNVSFQNESESSYREIYLREEFLLNWKSLWTFLVMFRAWIFRASGELGLLCIGPRAGRAFLYRVSSFFRAFPKYKMYPHFCLMSMKYEVFLLSFLKLSIGYKFGPR